MQAELEGNQHAKLIGEEVFAVQAKARFNFLCVFNPREQRTTKKDKGKEDKQTNKQIESLLATSKRRQHLLCTSHLPPLAASARRP